MKKLAYVLGFLFVAGMGMTTYASTIVIENDVNITIVDQGDDENPCPKGCTCEKCEKAKTAKADCKTTKACCKKEAKCDKTAKKCCRSSKSAAKTNKKVKTTTTTTK